LFFFNEKYIFDTICSATIIVPCSLHRVKRRALFIFLFFIELASSFFELRSQLLLCSVVSKGEGTALQILNELHNYHNLSRPKAGSSFCFLFSILEVPDKNENLRIAGLGVVLLRWSGYVRLQYSLTSEAISLIVVSIKPITATINVQGKSFSSFLIR
jgi:hypothetical protein